MVHLRVSIDSLEQGMPAPEWKLSVQSVLQMYREQRPILQSHSGRQTS